MSPPAFDAIVFDYDDTLADTVPARVEAMRRTFEETGLPYDPAEFVQSMRGLPLKAAFDQVEESEGRELDLLAVYRRHYWGKEPGFIFLYDGVRELLDALKRRGMPMGILTSKAHDILIEGRRGGASVELEELGVAERFPCVVGFEDVADAKPHPEGLLRVLACIGAEPGRALVVGDSWADVEAARNGGARSCLATWGLDDPQEQLARAAPDYVIDAPAQLLALLDG